MIENNPNIGLGRVRVQVYPPSAHGFDCYSVVGIESWKGGGGWQVTSHLPMHLLFGKAIDAQIHMIGSIGPVSFKIGRRAKA